MAENDATDATHPLKSAAWGSCTHCNPLVTPLVLFVRCGCFFCCIGGVGCCLCSDVRSLVVFVFVFLRELLVVQRFLHVCR